MMRNVEIKARVNNLIELLKRAEIVSNSKATIIPQDDTFFKSDNGRLKLRKFEVNSYYFCTLLLRIRNDL